jgi:hypothetical protein
MTRKKYDENEDGNEDVDHKYDSYSDYDSDYNCDYEEYDYELYKQEILEERAILKWWDELTNNVNLYHLKNLSYSWFEELLETGVRPEQFQMIFKDEIYDFPIFEQVPLELIEQGITQELWELIS